jgi:hypothetical protein
MSVRIPMALRTCAPALAALVAMGCASSGTVRQEQATVQTQNVRGPDFAMQMSRLAGPGIRADVIGAPVARVWPAIAEVYTSLGLPITDQDPETHILATNSQRLHRIADERMQNFFDCGGDLASRGNTTIFVTVSSVAAASGENSSTVRTAVSATAASATQSTAAACHSTGRLERMIAERLRQQFGTTSN